MRCLGCAAKTSHQVLQAVMQDAVSLAIEKGANPDLMPPSGLETDSASLPAPPGVLGWVQSVDILSEIVSDPFLLGEIATVHALSDIYASLAKPLFSLAIINLPETELSIQTNQLTHILAGALLAHSRLMCVWLAVIQVRVAACLLALLSLAVPSNYQQKLCRIKMKIYGSF